MTMSNADAVHTMHDVKNIVDDDVEMFEDADEVHPQINSSSGMFIGAARRAIFIY